MSPETHLFRLRKRWTVLLVTGIVILALVALWIGLSDTDVVSRVANEATEEVARHPGVVERLGAPITISGQATGNVRPDRGVTRVDVVVPVAGSRARGTLYASGVAGEGRTTFSSMSVVIGKERVEVPISPR